MADEQTISETTDLRQLLLAEKEKTKRLEALLAAIKRLVDAYADANGGER